MQRIRMRRFIIAAALAWHYSAPAVMLPATRNRARQPARAPHAAPVAVPAPAPAYSISLCAATIDTAPVAARAQASGRPADKLAADVAATSQTQTARGVLPYIVQFHGPVQEAWKQDIYKLQITIYNYIPENAFIVECAPHDVEKIAALPCVRWIGAYQPAYKLPPSLTRAAVAAPARRTGQTLFSQPCTAPAQLDSASTTRLDVTVFVFAAKDKAAVIDLIKQTGGVAVAATATRLRARLPAAALATVARCAAVAWIERYLQPQIMNNVAVTGPLMNVTPVWDTLGLRGNGQIIGHADTGLDTGDLATLMPDFTNRIRAAFAIARSANDDWSDQNGHGTHTAGSILGNGSAWSNGLFRGVAYEAQLVHQSIGDNSGMLYPPGDLNVLFIQAYTNGARIHSDSWGGGENGEYNAMSQDVDEFMWQHPDMLVVFSAGNGAGDYNMDGRIDPDSIAPPATAKNLLAVGAAESQRSPGAGGLASAMYGDIWRGLFPVQVNTDFISTSADGVHQGIAAFSGRGPTDDGRTKPDLVAPGTDIISCRSHMPQAGTLWGTGYGVLYNAASNDYTFSGGTSMATPLVAGAAALVRQYFTERHVPAITNPSAALVKATLISGARSLTPGQYGYGATREIPPAPRPNNVEGWGQVDLAATLTNLTVYTTNALATGGSDTFTVVLTDTNMVSVCLAWTDYPAAPGAGKKLINDLDLHLVTPNGATLYPNGLAALDRLNNVETIDIMALPPGTSTLYVTAYTVPQGGRQPYALVIRSAAARRPAIAVQSVVRTPQLLDAGTPATITAGIASNASGIASVTLQYSINGSWSSMPMYPAGGTDAGAYYTNTLAPCAQGSVVEYLVCALANDGSAAASGTGSYVVTTNIVYVAPAGPGEYPYDTWDRALPDIRSALALVRDGWQVIVTNGVYHNFMMVLDRAVTLRSVNGAAATIIDGGNYAGCLQLLHAGAVVDGFTIRHGYGYMFQGGGAAGGVGMTNGLVRNCVIEECGAGGWQGRGAGVFCLGAGVVENSRLSGNYIDGGFGGYGAGAYLQDGGLLRNCLIVNNANPSSFSEGGGVYAYNGGTLVNCTISGNNAGGDGSGFACTFSNVVVHNTIIYHNTRDNYNINSTYAYNPQFTYCALTPARVGTGNLSSDPLFVNNSVGDYHLLSNSPCVNAGSTATYYVGATDVAGNARVTGGMVDMGAYEFGAFATSFSATPRVGLAPLVVAFTARVSGSNTLAYYLWDFNNDGLIETQGLQLASPQHSYTNTGIYSPGVLVSNSVGECAAWSATDYIIVLASNVMFAAPNGGDQWPYNSWASAAKNIQDAIDTSQSGYTVLLSNGIYRLTSPLSIAKAVTVRGVQGNAATVLDGQATVLCVQLGNSAAVLDGVTISNGYGYNVGGVRLVSGTARNCRIINNKAYYTGAGVLFDGGGRVEDSVIVGNGGGGDYNDDPIYGGGVAFNSAGTLERCAVTDNQGYQFGGIYLSGWGTPVVRNCLVARNQGLSWMGGVGGWSIAATLENNTIVENTAAAGHSAGVNIGGGTLRNNIIYYNTVAGTVSNIGSGMGPFSYTCTWPGYAGTGNLTNDPRLVNRAARNYQLSGRSDCVNAGLNQTWMNTAKDLNGANRIINGIVDLGAYELATNSPLLRVQPASLNFGSVVLDQTASRTLTVRNVGGSSLTGALSGVAAPFAVSGASAYNLVVNGSATLTLQFMPEAERGYTNAVVASGGGDATIMLYGTGVPEPALLLPLLLPLLLCSLRLKR